MKNSLTVSICMYNAEKYIKKTLQCLTMQTMQNFYLLIVDDCSTDQSIETIERFFREYPRQYELIKLKENRGIANARQIALTHATTKYMIYIDSDDCPLPQLLEKEYNVISSDRELIAVSSWSQFVDAKGNRMKGGLFIGDKSKAAFIERAKAIKRIFLPIQTLFDRECALRVGGFRLDGFPEGKPRYRDFCEDLDLWTRMSDLYIEGKYMVVLPEVLYLYRKVDGLSSNHFNMIIKMAYVKVNLRLRRSKKKELTFIDYYNSLSTKELKLLHSDAETADCLRNGVFYIKDRKILKGLSLIIKSIWISPSYFIDKVLSNSGIIKKKL